MRPSSRRAVLLKGVAAFALVSLGPVISPAQELRIKLPDPSLPISPGSGTGQSPVLLTSPLQARSMASEVVASLQQIASRSVINDKQLQAEEQALRQGAKDIFDLESLEQTALSELRAGFFCSQCMRSKTELETVAECSKWQCNFQEHLRQVNGHAIPATPEQYKKKQDEFEAKLNPLRQQQQQRRHNQQNMLRYKEDLTQQFRQGLDLWKTALTTQKLLMENERTAGRRKDESDIKTAKDNIDQLTQQRVALAHKSPAPNEAERQTIKRIDLEEETWKAVLSQVQARSGARETVYWKDAAEADQNREQDFATLRTAIGTLVHDQPISIPDLPDFKASMGDWTLETSRDQMGVRFKFNKVLGIGLEVTFDRDSASNEAEAYVELFDRARIFAGTQNTNPSTGALAAPTGGIELQPSPNVGGQIRLPRPP